MIELLVAAKATLESALGLPVFVAGDVPPEPVMPYLTLNPIPEASSRITARSAYLTSAGVQCDIFAPTLLRAIEIGDATRIALSGQSVPATDGGTVMGPGLHPDGSWRVVRTTQPTVNGLVYHHHTILLFQREIHEEE